MTEIAWQDGGPVFRDGKLGTGQGCCCGGPCNPSACHTGTECTPPCVCQNGECKPACDPQECHTGTECTPPCVCQNGECKPACDPQECPTGTECTPPCVCQNGQCVAPGGCCVIDGIPATQYTDQQSCEECNSIPAQCYEEMFLEDPEASCPDGWQGSGGYCYRVTNPESCDGCPGWCDPPQTSGACGQWLEDCPFCGECISLAQYGADPTGARGPNECDTLQFFETEVELPASCPDGTAVRIRGFVDDVLLIDGAIIEEGQHTPSYLDCDGAHDVSYDFTPSGRSFTVAAGDNHGGGWGYDLTICFLGNPFP